MKLKIWIDVYDCSTEEEPLMSAWVKEPTFKKPDNTKRYRIDLEIPDPNPVDGVVSGEVEEE